MNQGNFWNVSITRWYVQYGKSCDSTWFILCFFCRIIKGWPNTYTFTKQVAEDCVQHFGKGLPVAIFRPSISKHGFIPSIRSNFYPSSAWFPHYMSAISLSSHGVSSFAYSLIFICIPAKISAILVTWGHTIFHSHNSMHTDCVGINMVSAWHHHDRF